jgi:hypothetical protein
MIVGDAEEERGREGVERSAQAGAAFDLGHVLVL